MATMSSQARSKRSAAPEAPAQHANPLQNFLTPEAMLTPGIAGTLSMTIANTLFVSFGAPAAWTALLLSFVFGVLVLAETRRLPVRFVLYVLNSLVIFCMAWGVNSVSTTGRERIASLSAPIFVSAAMAQASPSEISAAEACAKASSAVADAQANGASPADINRMLAPCQTLSRDIAGQPPVTQDDPTVPRSRGFFAPWKF